MSRRTTILAVSLFALVCLAIGALWTVRTQAPPGTQWWAGKDATVRVEVWEAGKDLATVGMTLKKRTLDAMVAFGMSPTFDIDDGSRFNLARAWKEVQRLPPGERFTIRERDATLYIWIETPETKPAPLTRDSVAAGAGA